MADDPQSSSYEDVLAAIRRRVELRRSTGEYPEGLEDDLDRHFQRINALQGKLVTTEQINDARAAVHDTVRFDRSRPPAESRVPGTDFAQRAVSKAIRSDISNLVDQLREFAAAVSGALDVLAAAVDDPPRHVHPDITGSVYAFEQRLVEIERRLVLLDERPTDTVVGRLADLERRLAAVESHTSSAAGSGTSGTAAASTLSAARIEAIVALVAEHAPVLHLEAAPGLLLASLKQRDIRAEGTTSLADEARAMAALGLIAHPVVAMAHLSRLPADSIRAVVVTHLAPDTAVESFEGIVDAASRCLPAAGARIVVDLGGVEATVSHVERVLSRAGFTTDTQPAPDGPPLVIATR